MKIQVAFTIEVPYADLLLLQGVAETDNVADAAEFVRAEAEEYIKGYLEERGEVRSRTVRRNGKPVKEKYAW